MLFYRGNLERGWPFLIFDRLLLQAQWGDVSSFSMFPLNPGRSNILLVNIFFWCQWCDAWIKYNGKIWEHQKWSYWHVQDDIQKAQQGWPQKEGTIIFHVLTSLFGGMSFIYVDCPNSGGGDFIYPLVSKLSPFAFSPLTFSLRANHDCWQPCGLQHLEGWVAAFFACILIFINLT